MRHVPCILVAALLATGGGAWAGVRVQPRLERATGPVKPGESAALFVGVREFPYDDTLTEVRYAVDDAVDLAFLLAIERKPHLVDANRVVLALSGDPQKPQSQRNLEVLVAAGAQVKPAGQSDVLKLLGEQARAVGPGGVLIVAFATHGVSEEGTQYLLTASSILEHRQTSISETKVRDIVSRAGVPRALILLDACRQRLTSDIRNGEPDPRSAAALLRAIGEVNGQVVFSAAAAGDYAYDDDALRNGVFTAAVMAGLRCKAATDAQGFVTVDTLSTYVEDRVLQWVRKNRDPNAKRATQLECQGRSKAMPLSICNAQ